MKADPQSPTAPAWSEQSRASMEQAARDTAKQNGGKAPSGEWKEQREAAPPATFGEVWSALKEAKSAYLSKGDNRKEAQARLSETLDRWQPFQVTYTVSSNLPPVGFFVSMGAGAIKRVNEGPGTMEKWMGQKQAEYDKQAREDYSRGKVLSGVQKAAKRRFYGFMKRSAGPFSDAFVDGWKQAKGAFQEKAGNWRQKTANVMMKSSDLFNAIGIGTGRLTASVVEQFSSDKDAASPQPEEIPPKRGFPAKDGHTMAKGHAGNRLEQGQGRAG